MNKDNNKLDHNGENGEKKTGETGRTRSFTNTKSLSTDGEMKLNTNKNIKKAKVKRTVKKGAFGTYFVVKKVFQWTFNILLTLLLVGTICGIIVGGAFYIYVRNDIANAPGVKDYDIDPADMRSDLSQTSWIYYDEKYDKAYTDEDGNPLYAPIELYGTENRSWAYYDEIPKILINAFVAIEDERFWQHNGVDWKRTFSAAVTFITGTDDFGGSTITQQLIKNETGEDETTIQRKITEMFRALSLSENRTKEEVIEMYLNKIHLSRSNYGVLAAAKYYFGKDLDELTICECAALASIPKSPTKYDPVRNPDENKKRRELVIDKMYELGWISKDEHDEALDEELVLNITYEQTQDTGTYSYFTDALIEQIIDDLAEEYDYTESEAVNLIYTGGLKIYTTEDPRVQSKMEEIFADESTFKKVDDGVQPESAMVVMDPYTGEVVGIVGGRGEKEGKRGLNRATMSTRQCGSSIKPLTVYAPAMDLGLINSASALDDTPIFMESMNRYWPSNSPNRYNGHITLNEAIIKSKNTTAVKLVKDSMGVDYVYDFAKNTLHLDTLIDSDKNIAPLALGGFTNGVTVMDMTAAYSIFPNGGYYSPARLYTKVVRSDGTILLDRRRNEEEYVVSKSTATVMTKLLENVVWSGTASKITLKQKINVAGKTGSTNDNKDIYFCGFTPYYVSACWFGYDIPKDLTKFGTNPAMLAWEKVMEAIHEPYISSQSETPLKKFDYSKLKSASFCIDSGLLATDECRNDPRGTRETVGYFYDGKGIPTHTCNAHTKVEWCLDSDMPAGENCTNTEMRIAVRDNERDLSQGEVTVLDSQYVFKSGEKCTSCTQKIPKTDDEDDNENDDENDGENYIPDDNVQDGDIFEVNDDDYDPTLDFPNNVDEDTSDDVEYGDSFDDRVTYNPDDTPISE